MSNKGECWKVLAGWKAMTGFIDHSVCILISPLQSWEFPQEPCWRRGTGHQRLGSRSGLQVKQLQKKWEEKCPEPVLFSRPFYPLRVVCGWGCCCKAKATIVGHLETSPGWRRRSGQLPFWFHTLPLRSKQDSKKKATNTRLQVCFHPLKKLRPGN